MTLKSKSYINQSGNVYLKAALSWDEYVWGGRTMRADETTANLGGNTPDYRFDPNGGIEIDGLLEENPGTIDFSLVLKHVQFDRMKTELLNGYWNIDKRYCSRKGRDRDNPEIWADIERMVFARRNTRTMPLTSWDSEEASMITIAMQALGTYDLYNNLVATQIDVSAITEEIVDVGASYAVRFGTVCGASDVPAYYAVSNAVGAANPYLLYNAESGDPDAWQTKQLTITTDDAKRILVLGRHLIIVLQTTVLTLTDFNANPIEFTSADLTANPPNCVAGLDQSLVLFGADNGYVFASYNGGRDIEVVHSGQATTNNIVEIAFAPGETTVVYAITDAQEVLRSVSGGLRGWENLGTVGSVPLVGLYVKDEDSLLVVANDKTVYETIDAGANWTAQAALTTLPTGSLTRADIHGDIHDELWMSISDEVGFEGYLYRNVDGGASGRWELYDLAVDDVQAVAAHDVNTVIAVGGDGAGTGNTITQVA